MTRQDGRRRKSQRIETFDRIVIFAGRVEIHPVRTHLAGKPGCIAVAQSVRERCDARNNQQAAMRIWFSSEVICLSVWKWNKKTYGQRPNTNRIRERRLD